MKEIIELLRAQLNHKGEIHLNAIQATMLLKLLTTTSKALDNYESLMTILRAEVKSP